MAMSVWASAYLYIAIPRASSSRQSPLHLGITAAYLSIDGWRPTCVDCRRTVHRTEICRHLFDPWTYTRRIFPQTLRMRINNLLVAMDGRISSRPIVSTGSSDATVQCSRLLTAMRWRVTAEELHISYNVASPADDNHYQKHDDIDAQQQSNSLCHSLLLVFSITQTYD